MYEGGGKLHTVHPHVCGEHVPFLLCASIPLGSSPRVWGTCCRFPLREIIFRFIPTCVGNIPSPAPSPPTIAVHPHVCGEHPVCWSGVYASIGSSPRVWGTFSGAFVRQRHSSGSSPRVWGTLQVRPCIGAALRFIPTCVGNMRPSWPSCMTRRFIPTCVGNMPLPSMRRLRLVGSSPRVWGTSKPFLF